jgi:hypothetical protein
LDSIQIERSVKFFYFNSQGYQDKASEVGHSRLPGGIKRLRAMPTLELNQDERTYASSKMKLWKDAAGRIGIALIEDIVKQEKDLHPLPVPETTTTANPRNKAEVRLVTSLNKRIGALKGKK